MPERAALVLKLEVCFASVVLVLCFLAAIALANCVKAGKFCSMGASSVSLGVPDSNTIVANPIGTSGADGVQANLAGSPTLSLLSLSLPNAASVPSGGFLHVSAIAHFSGGANDSLGYSRVTKIVPGKALPYWEIAASFQHIGGPAKLIQVINGGTIVYSVSAETASVVARAGSWPVRSEARVALGTNYAPGFKWGFSSPQPILLVNRPSQPDTIVTGNELRILSEAPMAVATRLVAHQLRGKDLTEMRLTQYIDSTAVVDVPIPGRTSHPSLRVTSPSPNPSTGPITFGFELPTASPVTIRVLDLAGRVVRTLVEREMFSAGLQSATWDGRSDAGVRPRSGVYWVEVRAGGESGRVNVTLLR